MAVAGILDPGLADPAQGRLEPRLRHAEERPQKAHALELAHRRHAGQPGGPASVSGPHRHRLGLVLELMGGQEMKDAGRRGSLGEQAVARLARRRLDAGPGLGASSRQGSARAARGRASQPATFTASSANSGLRP